MSEKKKPEIIYPPVHAKIKVPPPKPLPFSLRNQIIIDTMELLGIQQSDLVSLPIQHFLKVEVDEERAIDAYNRHLEKRADLIQQIQETKKGIDFTSQRPSPVVVYEKHMAEVEENIIKSKEEMNKNIIRKIALNQLRLAYKIQHGESKIQRQSQLSSVHDEKLSILIKEAQEKADKQDFSQIERNVNTDGLLFASHKSTKPSDSNFEKRYMFLTEQRKQKLNESAKITAEKINVAQQRHSKNFEEKITKMKQRLEKNDEILATIPDKYQKRDNILAEKAEKRNERTVSVNKRNEEFVQKKINKVNNLLQTEQQNFTKVMKTNQAKTNEKLEQKAELLRKRNEAAEKIFRRQKEEIEEFKQTLQKRDIDLQQRQIELDKEMQNKLYTAKIELEDKTAAIRRAQRARDCQTAFSLRQKVFRSESGLNGIQKQRARSQLTKAKMNETFIEKRNAAMNLLPDVVNLNDQQKVRALIQILGISENEANEMIQQAKVPNPHAK